jgi:hypothetical protein
MSLEKYTYPTRRLRACLRACAVCTTCTLATCTCRCGKQAIDRREIDWTTSRLGPQPSPSSPPRNHGPSPPSLGVWSRRLGCAAGRQRASAGGWGHCVAPPSAAASSSATLPPASPPPSPPPSQPVQKLITHLFRTNPGPVEERIITAVPTRLAPLWPAENPPPVRYDGRPRKAAPAKKTSDRYVGVEQSSHNRGYLKRVRKCGLKSDLLAEL